MSQNETKRDGAAPANDAAAGRLTAWVESLSKRPHAQWILFGVAVVEAAVFPLPPDPLFITLSLGNPRRSFWFAFVCALGSVTGSLIGYGVGSVFFESVGRPLLSGLGVQDAFAGVLLQYREHGIMTLILAGFTPVPFAVLTIAAGFNRTLPLATLILGSVLGRALRFGLLGGLLMAFGEPVKRFLASHRAALAAAVILVCVVLFLSLRWFL